MSKIRCFFAYSNASNVGSTIERAIELIHEQISEVEILSWRKMNVTGKYISDEVMIEIKNCHLFICDLTDMNQNVLFELGYAIAQDKKIWIVLDKNLSLLDDYNKNLRMLTTIGYVIYENAYELCSKFISESPYHNLQQTIYKSIENTLVQAQQRQKKPSLLYLKNPFNTDASRDLEIKLADISRKKWNLTIDDPQETTAYTLSWYAEKIFISFGILIHFPDEKRIRNSPHKNLNPKFAFIAGLSLGFDRQVLILAEYPHNTPIDYRDMTQIHNTASECVTLAENWLGNLRDSIIQKINDRDSTIRLKASLGDFTAENESAELVNYFVETAEYKEGLKTENYMIFVGRKGSGKTANLYYTEINLRKNHRNFVCVIKPVDYDFEGILEVFTSITSNSVRKMLAETIWQYLIYTEIAQTMYYEIKDRPIHHLLTPNEQVLINFVEKYEDIILDDFSFRLEKTINLLRGYVFSGKTIEEQRQKINERIHSELLSSLLDYLSNALSKKRAYILIDNLDKAWQKRDNLDVLAEFLFGLLSVSDKISLSFKKQKQRKESVNLSLIIYLRSDIFLYLSKYAREQDKLRNRWISWTDKYLLQSIIEKRLTFSLPDSNDIWNELFVETVNGVKTKDYIIEQIIQRPRDIIYFSIEALSNAINRNHSRIEVEDIEDAKEEYSIYVIRSLMDELIVEYSNIEEILYAFVGEDEILHMSRIEKILDNIIPQGKIQSLVDLLCDTTFLGRETEINKFEFVYDERTRGVKYAKAKKYSQESGTERYKINIPFHIYLDIKVSS